MKKTFRKILIAVAVTAAVPLCSFGQRMYTKNYTLAIITGASRIQKFIEMNEALFYLDGAPFLSSRAPYRREYLSKIGIPANVSCYNNDIDYSGEFIYPEDIVKIEIYKSDRWLHPRLRAGKKDVHMYTLHKIKIVGKDNSRSASKIMFLHAHDPIYCEIDKAFSSEQAKKAEVLHNEFMKTFRPNKELVPTTENYRPPVKIETDKDKGEIVTYENFNHPARIYIPKNETSAIKKSEITELFKKYHATYKDYLGEGLNKRLEQERRRLI
ncbi:MAG: hypothetical protein LBG46_04645 [Elusimicrobiota bacterium]|nr:hypothetical protein [Elusimicrobiota bacterium]